MVSRLAFLDYRRHIASKVLPNAYDGVRYLSSKGKYAYLSSIAQDLWLYPVGGHWCSGESALGAASLTYLAFLKPDR